jgi:hypothetical protein
MHIAAFKDPGQTALDLGHRQTLQILNDRYGLDRPRRRQSVLGNHASGNAGARGGGIKHG